MVVALQSYLNDLTVESNIRRSARIVVFNPQPRPADPKIAYMHANISQIKTARIHYIFKVFKPRRVCCRVLDMHIISNDQQIKLILASGSSSSATISLDVWSENIPLSSSSLLNSSGWGLLRLIIPLILFWSDATSKHSFVMRPNTLRRIGSCVATPWSKVFFAPSMPLHTIIRDRREAGGVRHDPQYVMGKNVVKMWRRSFLAWHQRVNISASSWHIQRQ